MVGLGTRVISPGERLFRPLNNLMLFTSTLTHVLVAKGLSKQQVGPGTFHTLQSDIAEWQILMPGWGPLEDAIAGDPERPFEVVTLAANMVHSVFKPLADMPGYVENIAIPLFLFHFESCSEWLRTNGHGDTSKWPMTIDFARYVRNAASHGGKLEVRNPAYRTVTWGSLSYSAADNGKRIIGTDIFFSDMLALMIQTDDELAFLGAPR